MWARLYRQTVANFGIVIWLLLCTFGTNAQNSSSSVNTTISYTFTLTISSITPNTSSITTTTNLSTPMNPSITTPINLSTTPTNFSTTLSNFSTTSTNFSITSNNISTTPQSLYTTSTNLSSTSTNLSTTPTSFSTTSTNVSTTSITSSSTSITSSNAPSTSTIGVTSHATTNSTKSSTTQTTAATTRSHQKYPMPIEHLKIAIAIQVKFNSSFVNWTSDCNKLTDEDIREQRTKIETQLNVAFNCTPGFQNIIITEYWNGCSGVSLTVYFKNVQPGTLKAKLETEVYNNLTSNSMFDKVFFNERFKEDVEGALNKTCTGILNKCRKAYSCILHGNLEPYCEHLCSQKDTKHMCQNGGYCVLNTDYKPVCRCLEDEDFLYGGEKCEVNAEKLELRSKYIIAIAAGGGGGIILILLIISIITCKRNGLRGRRQRDNVLDNVSEQSYKSFYGSDDETRQPDTGRGGRALPSYDTPVFRLSEERAENPRFNPYLSLTSAQAPVSDQTDFGQGFHSINDSVDNRHSQRVNQNNAQSVPERLFQDRVPNYGDPAQLPRSQDPPTTRGHIEIVDKPAKPIMFNPTKAMRRLAESKHKSPQQQPVEAIIFDYSPSNEHPASESSNQPNGTKLYDFDYENSIRHEHGVNDPYSMKRPLVSSHPI